MSDATATLDHVLTLAATARRLSEGPRWKTALEDAIQDYGDACDALWNELYRLLDERAANGTPVKVPRKQRQADAREALRREIIARLREALPNMVDDVLADLPCARDDASTPEEASA